MLKYQGEVHWFNSEKGYGFIKRDGHKDLFVHWRDIQGEGFKSLEQGQWVEFDIEDTEKGLKAANVSVM